MTGPAEAKCFLAIDSLFLQAPLSDCNILGPQIYRTCIYLFIIDIFSHVSIIVEFCVLSVVK